MLLRPSSGGWKPARGRAPVALGWGARQLCVRAGGRAQRRARSRTAGGAMARVGRWTRAGERAGRLSSSSSSGGSGGGRV